MFLITNKFSNIMDTYNLGDEIETVFESNKIKNDFVSNPIENNKKISGQIKNIIENKNYFYFIKSKYILKQIFEYLNTKRKLEILKCCKKMQKKLEIVLNDFKDYSEKFSNIVIEIIPSKNKYGKFINYRKNKSSYFYIYFNDNSKRVNKNYISEDDNVKKINILINYHIDSFYELFFGCDCIESMSFKQFSRINIKYMNWMFYGCSFLKHLNLSNFKTINVVSMKAMFSKCISLKKLDLSNFNTDNVTNMCEMFCECSSLKELDLSNFKTNKVTNMNNMFDGCSSLKELNISKFNTDNLIEYDKMFDKCSEELIEKIKTQNKNLIYDSDFDSDYYDDFG